MKQGIKTKDRLRCLRPILAEWITLNRRLGRRWMKYSKDAPWWYNERALLSVFVGAVWQSDENAFEEFSEFKRHRKRLTSGRIDLWFSAGTHEFWAEAKRCWIPMTKSEPKMARVTEIMDQAKDDVRRPVPDGSTKRLAIVFGVPYLKETRITHLEDKLESLIEQAKEVEHDAIAWVFPKLRRLPAGDGSVCPGIIVWIRKVRR